MYALFYLCRLCTCKNQSTLVKRNTAKVAAKIEETLWKPYKHFASIIWPYCSKCQICLFILGLWSQIRIKRIQIKAHVWNTVNFILESMVQMKRYLAPKGTRVSGGHGWNRQSLSKLLAINHQVTPPIMFWLGIKT